MNPLQKIEDAACEYASSRIDNSDEDCSFQWDRDYNAKFAELIIQECLNIIEQYPIPIGNSAAGELAAEWTYEALEQIRDIIKETFEIKDESI